MGRKADISEDTFLFLALGTTAAPAVGDYPLFGHDMMPGDEPDIWRKGWAVPGSMTSFLSRFINAEICCRSDIVSHRPSARQYVTCMCSRAAASANLMGANLSGLDISHADLSAANLCGADLGFARLNHANLRGANLSVVGADDSSGQGRTNLYGANLSAANLEGANLTGVDLYGVNLKGASLEGAVGIDLAGSIR